LRVLIELFSGSREHRPHGLERPVERIQDEPEVRERHDTQQGFVTRLAKDDRSVPFLPVETQQALGDLPTDLRAVRQRARHRSLRLQSDRAPHLERQHGIAGPAVEQEANHGDWR
jgi:hypothetical protein